MKKNVINKQELLTETMSYKENNQEELYIGSRGADFRNLIIGLLQRGNLKPKYIDLLTDKESMEAYSMAFTAASADPVDNYERFEQLGDVTANKFIVWYMYRRFPQLDCTKGVCVVARLRINYGAKQFFAPLAEGLGFWDYISAPVDGVRRGLYYRNRDKKDLLEDAFEAFVGCTEYLLDKRYRPGVGYGIVYDILSSIFDEFHISLRFVDLIDPVTRLKETFDPIVAQEGAEVYVYSRVDNPSNEGYTIAVVDVYKVPPIKIIDEKTGDIRYNRPPTWAKEPKKHWKHMARGTAASKAEAQGLAAEQAIEKLRGMGIYREPPKIYLYFCE